MRQKTIIPCVGGWGAARWLPKPSPLPKRRNCPQHWQILAESPVPPTWQRSMKTPTGRKKAPTGRKKAPTGRLVDTKRVMWPVWCGVRRRHFPAYSSIKGYNKKPFSQIRGGKPFSTLLQCQSLPTSFPRAVRSEFPAYIVARLYISQRRGIFGLSRRRFILQTTSLQRKVNNKNTAGHNGTRGTGSSLLFSRWKVLLHTVYIFNICNVDWG